MKPDDQLNDLQQLARIKKEAKRALEQADALGVFPTPIDEIVAAAHHTVFTGHEIDERFLARAGRGARTRVKSALSKVLGFLDVKARQMHLDRAVHVAKLPFLKLHELGHGLLPWQRDLYGVTADCEKTLDPEVTDMFERQSNAFATEVLFQLDAFEREAADHPFGIGTPLKLSRKYGASVYSTVRRYVTTSSRSCAVVVLEPPELRRGDGFVATLRRVVVSPSFAAQFGELDWPTAFTPDHPIGRIVPIGRKMSGQRHVVLADRNGQRHECVAEAFNSTHQVFILICPRAALTRKIVTMPG